jgi:hypothetical protein
MLGNGAFYFLCALGDTFVRFAVRALKLLTAKAAKKFRKVREERRAPRNRTTTGCWRSLKRKLARRAITAPQTSHFGASNL